MTDSSFYVYALRDPRLARDGVFYIAKGTGIRAFDHLVRPDGTRKYKRITEIMAARHSPVVEILVDELTELQALRIEAQLIATFGTVDTGGILLNLVQPSADRTARLRTMSVPNGCVERAQLGLDLVKNAIVQFAQANSKGVTNADVARELGLRSDYRGKQKDYLSYSLLGLLLRERRIVRKGRNHHSA